MVFLISGNYTTAKVPGVINHLSNQLLKWQFLALGAGTMGHMHSILSLKINIGGMNWQVGCVRELIGWVAVYN